MGPTNACGLIRIKFLTCPSWEGSEYAVVVPAFPRFTTFSQEYQMLTIQVNDMTCGHCASTITKALKALDPAVKVEIDLASHKVAVDSKEAAETVMAAIRGAGYSPHPA